MGARTYPAIPADERYCASSGMSTRRRAAPVSGRSTARSPVSACGIAGLGGTGAYILDLVAKTAVTEIRITDGDVFSQHNAFRAPGAPSLGDLENKPQKVSYFAALYSNMHKGIVAHDVFLDEANVALLDGLDFVFVCLDRGPRQAGRRSSPGG